MTSLKGWPMAIGPSHMEVEWLPRRESWPFGGGWGMRQWLCRDDGKGDGLMGAWPICHLTPKARERAWENVHRVDRAHGVEFRRERQQPLLPLSPSSPPSLPLFESFLAMPQQHVFFERPQPQPPPRSLRLRTGVVAPTRSGAGGPSTPVPSWKLYENPFYEGLAAAVAAAAEAAAAVVDPDEEDEHRAIKEGARERDADGTVAMVGDSEGALASGGPAPAARPRLVSTRKHAASLWEELQEELPAARPSPLCGGPGSSPVSHLQSRPSSLSNSDSPHSANPQPSKASKVATRSPQSTRSPQPPPSISPPLKKITLVRPKTGDALWLRNCASKSASSSQASPLGRDAVEQSNLTDKHHLADAGLITSPRDYIKALNRSRALEENQMDRSPIVSALSEELKRALTRVKELEVAQISARKEVDGLLKRCADERTMLRAREQEKIQAAVLSISEELDKERKARRKLEMENRKLSRSLAEASKVVVKAEKELDKERKARELMEDVCDELAREIGEDKAEVEELKREHAKARDEIEEERRTLQVTEAWREERVQMKLSEAKLELEERCMALDKLKMELDMYLSSRKTYRVEAFLEHQGEALREAVEKLQAETSGSMLMLKDTSCYPPHSQDDAVSSDDTHSLRLSRDNIRGQSEWVMHSNAHARDDAQWIMPSTEHARDRHAREESDWVESNTNAHFNVVDRPWTNRKPPSRRRRNEATMKSHGSRPKGLSSLVDKNLGEGRFRDGENTHEAESDDAGSHLEDAGEGSYSDQEEGQEEQSNWSADCDDDNRDSRQGQNASGSASEVEEENRSRSSPEPSRRMYRLSERMKEAGHDVARLKRNRGEHGTGRFGQHHDAGDTPMSVDREQPFFSHTRHNVLHAEDDSELSSAAGFSPVYKHHLAGPDFMTQKGSWPIIDTTYRSASQGRRAPVESSTEWSKPPRSNSSLEAKLLLEDRMKGSDFQLRHSKEVRSKR